jgi:hypothetical protein
MTPRRWLLAICCVAVWIIAGGPSIHNADSIHGQHDFVSTGVRFQFYFQPTFSEHGVPLVYHYFGAGMPATLRFLVEQPSSEFESLVIDEMKLVASDQPDREFRARWQGPFVAGSGYDWDPKTQRAEKTRSKYCEASTDVKIHDFGTYEFFVKGWLLRSDGTEVNFADKTSMQVTRQSHFRIYPHTFVYLIESAYKT